MWVDYFGLKRLGLCANHNCSACTYGRIVLCYMFFHVFLQYELSLSSCLPPISTFFLILFIFNRTNLLVFNWLFSWTRICQTSLKRYEIRVEVYSFLKPAPFFYNKFFEQVFCVRAPVHHLSAALSIIFPAYSYDCYGIGYHNG